ncbi:MAG: 23S rRNA (adenine(2503)-C(2))-methyltransferase RlmN [Bacteriovoracaceae bacterium]|nr:23S rRNA (adenine(2503)-C(2))-methyltransferase RlmN [Bacteriovoracaceae bacterium]
MENQTIYQISLSALTNQMVAAGHSTFSAGIVYRTLHKKGIEAFHKSIEISSSLKEWIEKNYSIDLPPIHRLQRSSDGTVKFLFKLSDGNLIESVLIPFRRKYTVCLSTQVGCAMKCSFCFTGTEGLIRNLTSGEIIGQYLACHHWLKENFDGVIASPNLVFMGQGEPLHNFDEVKDSINLLLQSDGVHLGERQITLSTCGYLPGLKRLKELPSVNIALSLHSPFDQIRDKLIPVNKSYPIAEVMAELKKVELKKKQFINFEYLLIDGINDNQEEADAIAKLLSQVQSIINIIPFNSFPGCEYRRPSEERIQRFKGWLVAHNLRVMVRTTKGNDILAACGQLKGNNSPK